jgi:hypothetical protein
LTNWVGNVTALVMAQSPHLTKFRHNKRPAYFLRVAPDTALRLISSLATMLETQNPNHGRVELFTNTGEYFTIAVDQSMSTEIKEVERLREENTALRRLLMRQKAPRVKIPKKRTH